MTADCNCIHISSVFIHIYPQAPVVKEKKEKVSDEKLRIEKVR